MMQVAADWDSWTNGKRITFLTEFAAKLLQIEDIRPHDLPAEADYILRLWLDGTSAVDMAEIPDIQSFSEDPSEIATFIEDLCGYRLPWAANSVLAFLSDQHALPDVCGYFSSLFKYGLVSPTAACIVSRVDQRRDLAVEAASVCPHHYANPDQVLAWFMNISDGELEESGVDEFVAQEIVEARDEQQRSRTTTMSKRRRQSIRLRKPGPVAEDIQRLGRVLVNLDDTDASRMQVYSLSGEHVGQFKLKTEMPSWLRRGDLAEAIVTELETAAAGTVIAVELREL